ncbi:Holliday junction resolvase RuvX [Candidatus Campbellbacteria bacterium CG10_big_fil_rev_8_21_14_0_10_35_52]|uniref:Putative pre-16S rRNA nuclease n=1 Tax=Candidatus Campbellbacteria bacterium CG10_big_fil_rev_8_21_14_0_10_35_52 TaxID=1974527 RepID=A0A2M6WVZ4_9BACT|nr:MAG: Holliday junction resolvase RuvX [Candidatus Campbellbacteria bacterium CG10_big_fil_rev_8_21_14_0_10_35_52]
MLKTGYEKILGIDFGTKKIGIAVSGGKGEFGLPKCVLKNNKDLTQNLAKIIQEENISEIVIGESINYKGDENPVMDNIKKFANEIKKKFNLPINFEPEFLTSSQAKNIQGDSNMIDASAAALILQSFLDKRNHKKN